MKTDVMQRGIPWTVMMLRRGKADSDLNLGWSHRVSTLLALGFTCALVLKLTDWFLPSVRFNGILNIVLLGTLSGFLALQYRFYLFLARKGGLAFAAGCFPVHVLYYWYSVFSVVAGVFVYWRIGKQDNALQG